MNNNPTTILHQSMHVVFLDTVSDILPKGLKQAGHEVRFELDSTPENISGADQIDGLVIRSRIALGKEELAHFPNLKFIARFGAGLENIDIIEAGQRNIQIFHAPEGNRQAVGELALGSLLNLFRNIGKSHQEIHQGLWEREGNRGIELQGKTIGIVGYGNTGSAFAKVLSGFGVRILAYDKYKKDFGNEHVEEVDLHTLCRETEILSLHLPLNRETKYWLDYERLEDFSKNLWLINTSRGGVVRTQDLVEAMQNGKVLGACLDVLEYEKPSFESLLNGEQTPAPLKFLLEAPNVVLTPHIGGWTHESNEKMAQVLLDKITLAFALQ